MPHSNFGARALRSTATLALVMAALATPAAPASAAELLVNGDFTQTDGPIINGFGAMLPTGWLGLTNSVPNAGQMVINGDGVFFFETYSGSALPPAAARTSIYQTFTLTEACECTLSFDYYLSNPGGGAPGANGAQVAVDHWPSGPADPLAPLFVRTFAADGNFNAWHRGATFTVSLSAGTHTLYLGVIARPMMGYNTGVVFYDNVSLSSPVAEPATAATLLAGIAGVLAARRRRPA